MYNSFIIDAFGNYGQKTAVLLEAGHPLQEEDEDEEEMVGNPANLI